MVIQAPQQALYVELQRTGQAGGVDRLQISLMLLRYYGSHPDTYARQVNDMRISDIDSRVDDGDIPLSPPTGVIDRSPDIFGMPPVHGLRRECKLFTRRVDEGVLRYKPWETQTVVPGSVSGYLLGSLIAAWYLHMPPKQFMALVTSDGIGVYRGNNTEFSRTGLIGIALKIQGFLLAELNRYRK